MEIIANLIDEALMNKDNESVLESVADKVNDMMEGLPLFQM